MNMPAPPALPGLSPSCSAVNAMIGRMGDKWTVMTIVMLFHQTRRFNDLKRAIGGVSQQMLTRTLRGLETDGLVSRRVIPTVPPQVEYSLTDLGRSFAVPVMALAGWVIEHMATIEGNRVSSRAGATPEQVPVHASA